MRDLPRHWPVAVALGVYVLWTHFVEDRPPDSLRGAWDVFGSYATFEECQRRKEDVLGAMASVLGLPPGDARKPAGPAITGETLGQFRSGRVSGDTIVREFERGTRYQHWYCLPDTIDPREGPRNGPRSSRPLCEVAMDDAELHDLSPRSVERASRVA